VFFKQKKSETKKVLKRISTSHNLEKIKWQNQDNTFEEQFFTQGFCCELE